MRFMWALRCLIGVRHTSMLMRASCSWAFSFLAACTTQLTAQALQAGDRVRVVLMELQPQDEAPARRQLILRGALARVTPDTLYLRPAGTAGALAIPRNTALSLHLSRGVRSRGRSAARAGFWAALLGASYTGSLYREPDRMFGVINRGEAISLGAGFGAALGGLWGATFPTERWRKVPQ